VLDGPIEKINLGKVLKDNIQLILAFAVFFFSIFTKFDRTVDLILFLTAYILIARDVIRLAIKSVVKGRMLDENFLMAIASIVAFMIGEYAEGVAVMLFYRVGQLTEEYALNRSKRSISTLLDLKPDFAHVRRGSLVTVDPAAVKKGEIIVVKPGEKIPLDGRVIKGTTSVDSAMLTGEALPVNVSIDSEVYAGTINLSGVIEVEVINNFENSAVSKILKMVQQANENKAHTEKFITKFAKVYTPLVVLGAALLAIIPPLVFGQDFSTWVYRGAIFLVVSCPCALVISVPLGYFGGIGGAAKRGILVKGGHFLEVLKQANTIVFDKTGTLTKGNFKVDHIDTFDSTEDEVLQLSASIETYSNHPIAKAVVEAFDGNLLDITDVEEVAGKGIRGKLKDEVVALGNEALMQMLAIDLPEHKNIGTTLFLSKDGKLIGILHINDEIKDQTIVGLKQLRKLGVKRFVMLTGDRKYIADHVGREVGISEVHAELLPGEKLEILEDILKTDKNVVFVGDGINDAPVLTRADVGIAMGNVGSDVAIESSDIVLMTDEITKVAEGVAVARNTSEIIWQNIVLALGIKGIIMILGAIGIANLWIAVFGDVGVAFIAILNSGRAIYKK
jgi:Cd2+/Zn2+-exporting ATPase